MEKIKCLQMSTEPTLMGFLVTEVVFALMVMTMTTNYYAWFLPDGLPTLIAKAVVVYGSLQIAKWIRNALPPGYILHTLRWIPLPRYLVVARDRISNPLIID